MGTSCEREKRLGAKQSQRSVQRLIEDECVAVAERTGSIVEERRRKQRAPAVQHLEQVLVDGDYESCVAAVAGQQVESGKELPAKEDRAANEVGRSRYKEAVAAARTLMRSANGARGSTCFIAASARPRRYWTV